MTECYRCRGTGWVPDGQPEDGRMTGRENCPICLGSGDLDAATVLSEIRRMLGATQ